MEALGDSGRFRFCEKFGRIATLDEKGSHPMRKHISVFMFLFAAVGLAGAARAAVTDKTAGYPYYEKGGTTTSDANVVYSTDSKNYTAIPPAGRKVGNWGWAQTGGEAQQYKIVQWENPAKTGPTYAVPSGMKAAVYFDYIPLTVTFNGNGGSGSMEAITNKNIDSSFTLTANKFAKTGYHFDHWANDLQKTFADQASVTGSNFWDTASARFHADLKAQWATNTYTVRFNGNGATGGSMDDESFAYDETKALTANAFEKTGFAFAGWATNAVAGEVVYTDKASVKNLTTNDNATVNLYARWTASGYTVTFDANGGGTPSQTTTTVTHGSTYGKLATCSRNGYSLDGWYTEKSGGTKITADTTVTITGALTLYAHWTLVTYTITYDYYKQGTASNPNPTTYTIESDDIVFQPPSEVPGYKFDKWDLAFIPKGSTGDKTVRASYLTITYRPSVHSPLTYNGYAQACFQTPLPTGVVAETPGEARVVGTYTTTFKPMPEYCWDDGTVDPYVVVWEIKNAKVENAVVTQRGTLTYTGEPQQPTVDARAEVKGGQTVTWKYSTSQGGYTETMPSFTDAGSYTVYFEASAPNHDPATGSFAVKIDRAKTAAVTVTPNSLRYTRKEQGPTVTLQHCHEEADSVKRATDVGTYAVKATPDENYAWSNGETAAREFTWSIDDSLYTVQFDGNGGTGEMASTNLAYNEEYVVPECAFTKTGCEFQRWQVLIDKRAVTNYLAGTVVSNLTTVAGKVVTFKAEWLGRYTIAFDKNGGEGEMASTNVERDVGFQLPSNAFTRIGYDFTTWTTNLSASIKPTDLIADGATVTNLVAAGETCTLHALWEAHHYTITFRANGGRGTGPADKDCVYGTEYELPHDWPYTPPKNYATFIGWSTNKNDTTGVYTVSNLTAVAGGIVALYAVWYYDVEEWSRVLDCNNLKFENTGWGWTIENDGAQPDSDECLTHSVDRMGYLCAELDESGTLTYWWKGDGDGLEHIFWVCLTEEKSLNPTIAKKTSIDSRDIRETQPWTKSTVKITVPAGEKRYVWFAHDASIPVSLDCVTWEPDRKEPEYDDVDTPVTGLSMSDGKLGFAFSGSGSTYHLLGTNDVLAPMPWPMVFETNKASGVILFEIPVKADEPKMFYRIRALK